MQCLEIQELLSAYFDGMLDPSVKERVDRHIEQCPVCRSEYDDLAMAVELVRRLPRVEPPEGFGRNLRIRLEQTVMPGAKKGALSRKAPGRRSVVTALAASFVLVFGMAVWSGIPEKFSVAELSSGVEVNQASRPDSVFSSGTEGAKDRLTAIPGNGSDMAAMTIQIRESEVVQPEGGVAPASSGRPLSGGGAADFTGSYSLMQERKFMADNGSPGLSARTTAPLIQAPETGQPGLVMDAKVKDKNAAVRELLGIARKLGGTAAVVPDTGGGEVVLKVPGGQYDKAIEEIVKSVTVVARRDYPEKEGVKSFSQTGDAVDTFAADMREASDKYENIPGVKKEEAQRSDDGVAWPVIRIRVVKTNGEALP